MDQSTVDKYLARIGAEAGDPLPVLQERHLLAIPFENLAIHLGEPISLDLDALVDKMITRRRGGFCYELNGLFAALLTALGHPVRLLAARVYGQDRLGPPLDHLALAVGDLLLDVGFGRFSRYPLRLDSFAEQQDPSGMFQLAEAEHGDIDVLQNGVPQYRLETRPRELTEFAAMCWWQQNSPDSGFTKSLTCSRLTADGRVTLSGTRLIHTVEGQRTEQELHGDTAVLAAYREHFGFDLDRVPVVRG
ncbi:arylamine N-acetyltransferase [Kutzneria viridogrisea]|uniref:N-hydroxyarylamine O-acetyltransferase n=1 Tax=Kutzneria viridogrisea TaxID=47990 RepID=A0ABR6BFJ6_9PSEU|nr:N-hydroxyarylamine O-acetyltransferase [Kutzneria viridogrisea]